MLHGVIRELLFTEYDITKDFGEKGKKEEFCRGALLED